MRALIFALQSRGHFVRVESVSEEDWFMSPRNEEKDIFYSKIVSGNELEVEKLFKHWKFFDQKLVPELIALSRNLETDPDKDEVTKDFAVGKQFEGLYDHCCSAFAAFATSSIMLELDFSTLKVEQTASATQTAVDQKMAHNRNILHDQREERTALVAHCMAGSRNEHNHTAEQVVLGCQQMLKDCDRRYSNERMQLIGSRRKFSGSLTAGDKRIHKKAAMRLESKFLASGRALLSDKDWEAKDRSAVQALTRHEQSLEAIKSVTSEDRVLAVLMEDKVVGQVGATKTFWSYLGKDDLVNSFSAHLPLASGFAKGFFVKNMIRDVSKTPKKANKAEILFSVKAIRDIFFTPRLLKNNDSTHIYVAGLHICINGSYCQRCKKVHAGCLMCFFNDRERKCLTAHRLLLRLNGARLETMATIEAERRRVG